MAWTQNVALTKSPKCPFVADPVIPLKGRGGAPRMKSADLTGRQTDLTST